MADSKKILYLHPSHIQSASPTELAAVNDSEQEQHSSVQNENDRAEQVLRELYKLIREKGMDPSAQLSGYLITEEPTYIPDYKNARALADSISRDKLLFVLFDKFFEVEND